MTELERALLHIKTRADAWAVKEVEKALSQEPTIPMSTFDIAKQFGIKFEPCDEVVSRQAVINLIRGCNSALEEPRIFDCHNAGVKFEQYVTELPPVTQKSGKWILLDECANSGYYCSNCQKKLVKEGWSQTVKKIKYCPNCGARMENEEG